MGVRVSPHSWTSLLSPSPSNPSSFFGVTYIAKDEAGHWTQFVTLKTLFSRPCSVLTSLIVHAKALWWEEVCGIWEPQKASHFYVVKFIGEEKVGVAFFTLRSAEVALIYCLLQTRHLVTSFLNHVCSSLRGIALSFSWRTEIWLYSINLLCVSCMPDCVLSASHPFYPFHTVAILWGVCYRFKDQK